MGLTPGSERSGVLESASKLLSLTDYYPPGHRVCTACVCAWPVCVAGSIFLEL